MRTLAALSLFLVLATPAWAETFTLTYQNQNKWVAQQDAEPLKALLDAAKKDDTRMFEIVLPKERELAIARLKVLRDILEKSLGHGVLLQEVGGETGANTLSVTPTTVQKEEN